MNWLDNAPADRMPRTLKKAGKKYLTVACLIVPTLFLSLEIFNGGTTRQLVSVLSFSLFIDLLFLITYLFIPLIEYLHVPKYIAFEEDKIMWKTKSGKEGGIPYSSIKSISRTGREVLKNWKIVLLPLQEEIYSVRYELRTTSSGTYSVSPKYKKRWVYPPQGLSLNKSNAKRLAEKLKKNGVAFDGDLDN